ncbi:MAG TPA: hypothetical protein VF210_11290 [Pseudomonadales bacterium]
MTAPADDDPEGVPGSPLHASRAQLVWDLVRFQVKLIIDGFVDVILSPMAWLAVLLGLLRGGDDPHRYFRELLRFGRRVEVWLNLFGVYRRRGTADDVMEEWRERVFGEPKAEEWLRRAGRTMNSGLDAMSARRSPPGTTPPAEGAGTSKAPTGNGQPPSN